MVPASIDNPYLDADINISGMLRVLEAARKTDVQKLSSLPPPRFMEIIPRSSYRKSDSRSQFFLWTYKVDDGKISRSLP